MTTTVNTEQSDYWNGDEASHWLVHEDRYDAMLQPWADRLLAAAAIAPDAAVLDLGCGAGATTLAAGRAAAEGSAHGVDLSAPMLRRAAERATEAALANVTFEVADAQVHSFPRAAYDVVLSRFGVMFFDDPRAAFANIRAAVRPGGALTFVCWQPVPENEWVLVPGLAATQHVAVQPLTEPGVPGPFAFGDPEVVTAALTESGWKDVVVQDTRERLLVGSDVPDTVAFLRDTGMGKRVLAGVDEPTAAIVSDAIAVALEPFATPDGVWLGSAAWLVTARNA
jgi:SAM-dependent methyltransferase